MKHIVELVPCTWIHPASPMKTASMVSNLCELHSGLDSLQDRSENKFPLMHQHMWNSETVRVYNFVTEDNDIQVDVSRALVDKLDSSMALLNGLKSIEKLDRAERSFNLI
jgi:hypothetical protein